jgi:hypothetical protein
LIAAIGWMANARGHVGNASRHTEVSGALRWRDKIDLVDSGQTVALISVPGCDLNANGIDRSPYCLAASSVFVARFTRMIGKDRRGARFGNTSLAIVCAGPARRLLANRARRTPRISPEAERTSRPAVRYPLPIPRPRGEFG